MDSHLSLLDELAGRGAEWVEPDYDPATRTVTYPDLSSTRGEEGASVLEHLREEGVLDREFVDRVVACPDCGDAGLEFELACPDCGSANTVEVTVVEHTECGCVRPREAFEDGEDVRCPECDVAIESVAAGCERMGTMHRCRACEGRSDALAHRLRCPNCGSYEPEAVDTHRLHRYRFDDDRRAWLDRLLVVRDGVAGMLAERGYTVERDAVVTGSGDEQPVSLDATDHALGVDLTVVVRTAIDVAAITRVETLASETESLGVLATAATAEHGAAMNLATDRGVPVIEVDEDRTVVADPLNDDATERNPARSATVDAAAPERSAARSR